MGLGIEEDNASEFRQELAGFAMEKAGQVIEIDAAALIQGEEQGVLGRGDLHRSAAPLDRALTEDGGFGRALGLFIVVFEGEQQGQVGVAAEGGRVGPLREGAEPADEAVVKWSRPASW
jgi:hypothetical protein